MKDTAQRGISSAVLLGSGNVARNLGLQMIRSGIEVKQVYSRDPEHARNLALKLQAGYTNRISELSDDAGIYIIAISDDAIGELLQTGCFLNKDLVVHTAGSVSLDVFKGHAVNYGILYPLQTFTASRIIEFKQVPFLVEAANGDTLKRITGFAGRISDKVMEADSDLRMWIHLAAVIASNFSNHFLSIASELLADKKIELDILKPLMTETIEKAFALTPGKAQTGPALRGNKEVIARHMSLLQNHPDILQLYKMISLRIAGKHPGN